MKYKYILFDLDGTLTDPKIGITKSVQYALEKNDIEVESIRELEKFIGPPLKDSFMQFYSFDDQRAVEAIEHYREYFKDKGIYENEVYKGIEALLRKLRSKGCIIAVATSKPTVFAKRIIEYFSLEKYFDIVVGSNLDGTRVDKAVIISFTINKLKIEELEQTVMIGDRKHDIIGALKNNVDSIGVVYGYGTLEELKAVKPTYIVDSIKGLYETLT